MKEFKFCSKCNEVKKISEFYLKGKSTYCIICTKIIDKEKDYKYKLESGGGLAIRSKPNQYTNDIQRDTVFDIMKKLGWTFNKNLCIWYKLPIKDENGNFLKIKKKRKKIICNDKKAIIKREISDKKWELITKVGELRESGYTINQIERKVGLSKPTVRKNIKLYYDGRAH